MSKKVIEAANGPNPSPILNNLIVSGDKAYLAGVLGTDASGKLVSGGVRAEAVQALRNAEERLRHAGLDLTDVVSVQIFLLDYATTLGQLNEVYAGCFPKGCQLPVRTAVGVAALPLGGSVEMTIIASTRG